MISYKLIIFIIILAVNCIANSQTADNTNKSSKVLEVSPTEDLMREHGILNRILLIYEEYIKRLEKKEEPFPSSLLIQSAEIIHNFIENYHEKLEEEFIFTKFEKAGIMSNLINTLKEQHQRGRILTESILKKANELNNDDQKNEMKKLLREFIIMYRPHEAREDTVLFPAFKTLVTQQEYDSLGEVFEAREQQLFGKEGFTKIVNEVASIEKALGIFELSKFTPNL